jgi:lysine 2,3-aminomutase
MSIHFSHPDEITPETAAACEMLSDAGIPLGSQTVLLRDINDDPAIMKQLFHKLLKIRVRPYYLYLCDLVPGSRHFRTPISKGYEIINSLRGFTSGYAIPHFVIDAPGGGGKIPLSSDYVKENEEGGFTLRNYLGKTYLYPDINSH